MIVVVTGGRDWTPRLGDRERLIDRLRRLGCTELRHGGASGLDSWAGRAAHRAGFRVVVYPATKKKAAEWRRLERAGFASCTAIVDPPVWRRWPSAGPLRNVDLTSGAHHVLAWDGGPGTASCRRAGATAGAVVEAMG